MPARKTRCMKNIKSSSNLFPIPNLKEIPFELLLQTNSKLGGLADKMERGFQSIPCQVA